MKPLVAIVGRPNVGKSTLFNRLAGKRLAIVEDRPGVTRDRHYADTSWKDREITVIDTGGYVPEEKDQLLSQVRQQAQFAVQECEVVVLVVDARTGLTAADQLVGEELRRAGKPVVVAVNKVDTQKLESDGLGSDFFRLGLGDLFFVSAEHGRGTEDLLDKVISLLPPQEAPPPAFEEHPEERPIRVAIVGRPNVGKSTLVNSLLNEERMVASEVPGTTRDAVDSELTFQDREFVLTDTAGIRRKASIAHTVEQFAVIGSLRAIDRSDVTVVMMDATEAAVDQDAKIISIAEEKGKALVVVVNKWDKVAGKSREKDFRAELKWALKFVSFAPVAFTTALDGTKVEKVLEMARMVYEQWQFRAPTPMLNKLLAHVTEHHPLPFSHGKPLKLYYIAQVAAAPPTFIITCNRPAGVPDRYKRYLFNQLRETFDLKVPLRVYFRERPGQEKRAARLVEMRGRQRKRS